jgi:hypothetical protein
MELGEHIDSFPQPVIENRVSDGFLGNGLAKNKFCTDTWSFKPKNHSKSFLGPHEGKLQ